jgi:cullin-associated NEDD8-dissociated protein 1
MLTFYEALVLADPQIATRIVPSLVLEIEKGVKATTSPPNVAKCLAKVVNADLTIAAGTIREFTNILKVFMVAKP